VTGRDPTQAYLEKLPATRHVYFVAGDRDFLLHIAVRDSVALRELVSDTLSLREEVAATLRPCSAPPR